VAIPTRPRQPRRLGQLLNAASITPAGLAPSLHRPLGGRMTENPDTLQSGPSELPKVLYSVLTFLVASQPQTEKRSGLTDSSRPPPTLATRVGCPRLVIIRWPHVSHHNSGSPFDPGDFGGSQSSFTGHTVSVARLVPVIKGLYDTIQQLPALPARTLPPCSCSGGESPAWWLSTCIGFPSYASIAKDTELTPNAGSALHPPPVHNTRHLPDGRLPSLNGAIFSSSG